MRKAPDARAVDGDNHRAPWAIPWHDACRHLSIDGGTWRAESDSYPYLAL